MPDEDMELATDYAGPIEDIDIDVEFAAAQPDDDMELGDFDQSGNVQHFTSDIHDELMAEGDDASYGMIDADEIDYNDGVVTANDNDIQVSRTYDNTWQSVPTASGNLPGQVDEIDYVHAIGDDGSTLQPTQQPTSDGGELHHGGEAPSDELAVPLDQNAAEDDDAAAAALSSDAHALLETLTSTKADNTLESEHDGILDHIESGIELNIAGFEQHGSPHYEQDDLHARAVDEFAGEETTDQEKPRSASTVVSNATDAVDALEEQAETQHHYDEEEVVNKTSTELGSHDGVDVHDEGSVLPLNPHQEQFPVDSYDTDEHLSDQNAHATADGGKEVHAHSYIETSNDQEQQIEAVPRDTAPSLSVTGSNGPTEANYPGSLSPEPDGGQDSSLIAKVAVTEHPASIATRYEIFINYGRTDYRLFAKSENDDPNQYFLSDMAALEQPLAKFLSSLRDVISQEVSPLDELVLHVDGLGLEFSESMTNDFLDRYTFGDILALFDILVKNEETESPPDLYCYLMVRPNCSQRLAALVDQANAGRGLTDVAIYREVTPMPGEGDIPGEDQQLAITPDDGHDDEYEEEQFEEHNQAALPDDDAGKAESEPDDTTTPGADDGTSKSHRLSGDQSADLRKGQATEDDLVDYDNIDVGPSQHDSNHTDPASNEAGQAASKKPSDDVDPLLATEGGIIEESASHNTSATATLDGDDKDEIDYSDNEENGEDDQDGKEIPTMEKPMSTAKLQVPVDDEITWESEDEGPPDVSASKQSVQVSPTSGKRTRSASGDLESAREQKDVKRRRS